MKFKNRSDSPLKRKASRGFRGFPVATLIYYGPDDARASKVAVGIVKSEGANPEITRLFSDGDAREDPGITHEILRVLQAESVKSVIATNRILGCPHEEGTDYPDGEVCPQCPFWARRDRFTGDLIQ
jgi:hypothetical protein